MRRALPAPRVTTSAAAAVAARVNINERLTNHSQLIYLPRVTTTWRRLGRKGMQGRRGRAARQAKWNTFHNPLRQTKSFLSLQTVFLLSFFLFPSPFAVPQLLFRNFRQLKQLAVIGRTGPSAPRWEKSEPVFLSPRRKFSRAGGGGAFKTGPITGIAIVQRRAVLNFTRGGTIPPLL